MVQKAAATERVSKTLLNEQVHLLPVLVEYVNFHHSQCWRDDRLQPRPLGRAEDEDHLSAHKPVPWTFPVEILDSVINYMNISPEGSGELDGGPTWG